MSKLIAPHGSDQLKPLLLEGAQCDDAVKRAASLPKIPLTSREVGDLLMLGIGAFTPLDGFMGQDDWRGVCDDMRMSNGLFWPIPITLSAAKDVAEGLKPGSEAALVDEETGDLMGLIVVSETYQIDKQHECEQVFKTTDPKHPGVEMVLAQRDYNVAGAVQVVSQGMFPGTFPGIYQRPDEARAIFDERGWSTVAALQLRNPMHNSHAYLAWVAIEVCDGVYIHQLLGNLKPGDIPADVRVRCIDALVNNHFRPERVVQGGYPLDMRYAGPREALLHAVFRQNYGCSHLIVGRDHAGVGDYYGPFDAQSIFDELPEGALKLQALKMDWTFYCYKCGSMASMKTCPHGKDDRLMLSGTALRKMMTDGEDVPVEFSKPEVIAILREYYAGLDEKVEIKLHNAATGKNMKS